MGVLESGSIYLHKMCRHPQEPGGTHIQSEVSQPGPVDLRTDPGTVFILVCFGSGAKGDVFFFYFLISVILQTHTQRLNKEC